MKLLIHTCCAPCLTYTAEYFSKDYDIKAFWFNPNIHPYKEYERRMKALKKFEKEKKIDIIYKDKYPLSEFLYGALKTNQRCDFCYRWRLRETAKKAAKLSIKNFSTTLLLSPYQNHALIKQIGGEEGRKNDVKFIYVDLTDGFRKSHEMADKMNLYKQGYCGCIFSEMERYKK